VNMVLELLGMIAIQNLNQFSNMLFSTLTKVIFDQDGFKLKVGR